MSEYQIEELMKNYARELRSRLSKDVPHIDVSPENYRDESSVGVSWPLIKPPEVSKLRVVVAGGMPREIWISGEFYLSPDKVDVLGVGLERLIPYHNNIGVSYERLPFNMLQLAAHLYTLPFEMHTRKTIECRMESIRESVIETVQRLGELKEKIELVVRNAPLPLLLEYQDQLTQVNQVVGELVGQIPLYRLPLRTIRRMIGRGQLPQTALLEGIPRRQLTGEKK